MISRFKRASFRRALVLSVAVVLCFCAAIGGTVAHLVDVTGEVVNNFSITPVENEITENFDGNVKTNVCVKNTGEATEWVRAYLVFTWKDETGSVYGGKLPVKDTDYTININSTEWILGSDGAYYYKYKVEPGASTQALITTCAPVADRAPAGYFLTVEVMASGIQSVPDEAFNAWSAGSNIIISSEENGTPCLAKNA